MTAHRSAPLRTHRWSLGSPFRASIFSAHRECHMVFVIGKRENAVQIASELTLEPKDGYRVVSFGIPGHHPRHGAYFPKRIPRHVL